METGSTFNIIQKSILKVKTKSKKNTEQLTKFDQNMKRDTSQNLGYQKIIYLFVRKLRVDFKHN